MILRLETILLLGIIFLAFWVVFCLSIRNILHLIKTEEEEESLFANKKYIAIKTCVSLAIMA